MLSKVERRTIGSLGRTGTTTKRDLRQLHYQQGSWSEAAFERAMFKILPQRSPSSSWEMHPTVITGREERGVRRVWILETSRDRTSYSREQVTRLAPRNDTANMVDHNLLCTLTDGQEHLFMHSNSTRIVGPKLLTHWMKARQLSLTGSESLISQMRMTKGPEPKRFQLPIFTSV